ncbi:pilus assembly protein TadE [Paraburkholderia steynii]|uniref:Pilus assembly protein TadE n=1 Tax=Paraburkholderia steynii TaxID=1245441 RepID=A0A4R0XCX2_9BURK|nr:pilus assembly protein TadE [Paraburkholderia steynii]
MWFVGTLTFVLALGAFAIDVPRVLTVTNELQNAADAAALAGAAALSPTTGAPNWSGATAAASNAIQLNDSDGKQLVSGTVNAGYWDVSASSPTLLAPASVTLPAPAGQLLQPAVKVTIARNGSSNGVVTLLLGELLGTPTATDSATAVAVIAPPSTVPAGGLFPVAMDQCVFDQYWNSQTNQPKLDPSTNQPYEFQIGNGQQYGSSCDAGQWTSFATASNNVPTIRNLIKNGNPTPLSVGDNIYIEPGVETTIYGSVPTGVTVVMPVAAQIASKNYVPIVAFAAFHIDGSYGGSSKYIQGHFVASYKIPVQGSGVGTVSYGAYTAARLAF